MKRLTILLPVYFLILACLPCADTEASAVVIDQSAITTAGSHGHNTESETCPPFCTCNCCGQRAPAQRVMCIASTPELLSVIKQTSLQPFARQNVLQQIWQPPQLV